MTETTEMMEMIPTSQERLPEVEDPKLRRYKIKSILNLRFNLKKSMILLARGSRPADLGTQTLHYALTSVEGSKISWHITDLFLYG